MITYDCKGRPSNCPHCGENLIGDPIPEDIRERYSSPYVWRREILVKPEHKFICPKCGEDIYDNT